MFRGIFLSAHLRSNTLLLHPFCPFKAFFLFQYLAIITPGHTASVFLTHLFQNSCVQNVERPLSFWVAQEGNGALCSRPTRLNTVNIVYILFIPRHLRRERHIECKMDNYEPMNKDPPKSGHRVPDSAAEGLQPQFPAPRVAQAANDDQEATGMRQGRLKRLTQPFLHLLRF